MRRIAVSVCAAAGASLALLAWGGTALAKAPPPKAKELSAISQYRESIPGASGPTLPGRQSTRTPLPPPVESAVVTKGGSDTHDLKKFAEESNFGAPSSSIPRITPRQRVTDTNQGAPAALFSGAGSLVADGQSGRVLALVVVMALLAGAAAVAAVRRRRPI